MPSYIIDLDMPKNRSYSMSTRLVMPYVKVCMGNTTDCFAVVACASVELPQLDIIVQGTGKFANDVKNALALAQCFQPAEAEKVALAAVLEYFVARPVELRWYHDFVHRKAFEAGEVHRAQKLRELLCAGFGL